jgi:hypothetical protein
MPIHWVSNDHKRLFHYTISTFKHGDKNRWTGASAAVLRYGLDWQPGEIKNAQPTRSKDPEVFKTGWDDEMEHTKYLTGLSGIPLKPQAPAGPGTFSPAKSESNASHAASSHSTTRSSSEFETVALRQLGKIAASLSCLPDISEKLGILCTTSRGLPRSGRKRNIYSNALKACKLDSHDQPKGVLVDLSDGSSHHSLEDEELPDDDGLGDDTDTQVDTNPGDGDDVAAQYLVDEATAAARSLKNDAKVKADREKNKTKSATAKAAKNASASSSATADDDLANTESTAAKKAKTAASQKTPDAPAPAPVTTGSGRKVATKKPHDA